MTDARAATDRQAAEAAAELAYLQDQLHQLILMRETGPKRAAWHMARTRMIWRLHAEIERRRALRTADPAAPLTEHERRASCAC